MTNVIYHSSSQQHLDKNMLQGLIAGGTGRREGRQECYFSAAHSQESEAIPDRSSWHTQLVPYVHNKRPTDTIYQIDMVQNTRYGSQILSHVQFCCCSLRRHSSRMHRKSRRTRSNDLVWKTIRSRTERTSYPNRSPCTGRPIL